MYEKGKKKKKQSFVDYTSNVFQENSLPVMKIKRCEEGSKVPAVELRATLGCWAAGPRFAFDSRLSGLQLTLRSSSHPLCLFFFFFLSTSSGLPSPSTVNKRFYKCSTYILSGL